MTLHGPRPEKRTLLDAHQCARHQAAYTDNDRFARIRRIRVARLSEPQKPVKEGEKILRNERCYGSVFRMLTLPFDVNAAKAEASYEGGVLTQMLPKASGVEAHRRAVH